MSDLKLAKNLLNERTCEDCNYCNGIELDSGMSYSCLYKDMIRNIIDDCWGEPVQPDDVCENWLPIPPIVKHKSDIDLDLEGYFKYLLKKKEILLDPDDSYKEYLKDSSEE